VPFTTTVPDASHFRSLVNCQAACPVGTDARGYVRAIANGDFERAYLIARAPNPLASICGRVCGAPCERACRRGEIDAPIAIRGLKRFVTERYGPESGKFRPLEILRRVVSREGSAHACEGEEEIRALLGHVDRVDSLGSWPPEAPTVAIIGSGPAGLACAHDLALFGVRPTVFEREPEPAGMLMYGIPEYRLPRSLIIAEVDVIRAMGVEFRCNTTIGVDVSFAALREQFDAVVVAVGAKNSRRIPLPGMEGPGVIGGVEFLREVAAHRRPEELGRRVVVIGGGNVAYDVARTVVRQVSIDVSRSALRQPAVTSVTLASLESLEEMPADDVEIIEGDEEGIRRVNSVGPVRIERAADGGVEGVCFRRCLRVFDEAGRFDPQYDDADLTTVDCDTVIVSIGQTFDLSFIDHDRDGVRFTPRGALDCDPETGTTSETDVFVAGDVAYGPRLLIHAVASGKKVARTIAGFLGKSDPTPHIESVHHEIHGYVREPDYEKIRRVSPPARDVADRLRSPTAAVEGCYTEAQARREASRCLDCGVNPIFAGSRCILCGGCVDVCPSNCLKLVGLDRLAESSDVEGVLQGLSIEPGSGTAILKDEDQCIRCGLCAERCPNHAITMERFCFSGAS